MRKFSQTEISEFNPMADCCSSDKVKFDGLSDVYTRAHWVVIAINGIMFLIELSTGIFAGSQALTADALDFHSDTASLGRANA